MTEQSKTGAAFEDLLCFVEEQIGWLGVCDQGIDWKLCKMHVHSLICQRSSLKALDDLTNTDDRPAAEKIMQNFKSYNFEAFLFIAKMAAKKAEEKMRERLDKESIVVGKILAKELPQGPEDKDAIMERATTEMDRIKAEIKEKEKEITRQKCALFQVQYVCLAGTKVKSTDEEEIKMVKMKANARIRDLEGRAGR